MNLKMNLKMTLIEKDLVDKISVGFYNSDFTEEKKDGKYYRHIKQATLYEVSLASFPATLKGTFFGIKSKLENFVLKLINKLF